MSIDLWILFGFLAQGAFFLRFFVQWLTSEKHKKSIIPVSFWYLSIIGGLMLLIYSIHLKDPVFIVGQSFGLLIYARNLVLLRKSNNFNNSI